MIFPRSRHQGWAIHHAHGAKLGNWRLKESVMDTRRVIIPPSCLAGMLQIPPAAYALVIFAHGSGSSRVSPRNMAVASALNKCGIATLLFDLLTAAEERDRANV